MEKKNIHKDHRKRIRARYFKEGIKSMADHNIVEFLLFFGIPYKDTNDIAHELIDKFGDLNGILEAPVEELMKVEGIGENAAALISLIHDIAVIYNDVKLYGIAATSEDMSFSEFLSVKYAGENRELVYLLYLDSRGKLQHCIKLCEGSPDSAVMDTRMVVEAVIRFDSKNVILAHNHPNGFAVPSTADVEATKNLVPVLRSIGVNLADHIIVAQDDTFSMASSRKYSELFR